MEFAKNTRLKDILNLPCFQQMNGQFIASSAGDWFRGKEELSLAELQQQNPTWYWEDVTYGLNRLQEIALDGGRYVYPVGKGVCLLHLPAENRRYEAYAILNAGGAYGAVCTMVEALPAAAKLNELGMDCFCLNYRTATQSSFTEGLMPKPLEDLALAWGYIKSNKAAFQLDAENYMWVAFPPAGIWQPCGEPKITAQGTSAFPIPRRCSLPIRWSDWKTSVGPQCSSYAPDCWAFTAERKK